MKLSVEEHMIVDITLQQGTRPVNIVLTITRQMFEDINKHLFDKVIIVRRSLLKLFRHYLNSNKLNTVRGFIRVVV